MIYRTRSDIVKAVENQSDLHLGGYKKRLYYCVAQIIYPDFSDFLILKSYSTIVAAYQISSGILWVFGFYSNTTVQHIAKFRVWLREHYYRVLNFPIYRRVRDKQGSHIEYEPFIPFVNE